MKNTLYVCCVLFCTGSLLAQDDVFLLKGRTFNAVSVAEDETDPKIAKMKANYTWLSVGVEGGIGINMFSQDIERVSFGNSDQFKKVFGKGKGIGEYLQFVADFGLSYKYGLQFKIGHQNLYVGNSGDIDNINLRNGADGKEISSKQNMDWEFNGLSYLTMGLGFRINATPELSITLGGILSILRQGKPEVVQTNTIISPENAFFDVRGAMSKSATQKEQIISASNDIQGVDIGVSYRFNVDTSLALIPKIGFQYYVSELFSTYSNPDNSMSTLQIGVSVRYNMQ